MSIWGTQSPASLKLEILDAVRALGATYMEASYSGGNDEGGVDDVTVFRPVTKENPAFLVYELHVQGYGPKKGELERDYFPKTGPFRTKTEAHEGAKAEGLKRGYYEIVQVTDDKVPLIGADVGNWEAGLVRLVDDLLSLEFGTWAGDFTAHGTVYADVPSGRVWRAGEVSTYQPDADAGEY